MSLPYVTDKIPSSLKPFKPLAKMYKRIFLFALIGTLALAGCATRGKHPLGNTSGSYSGEVKRLLVVQPQDRSVNLNVVQHSLTRQLSKKLDDTPIAYEEILLYSSTDNYERGFLQQKIQAFKPTHLAYVLIPKVTLRGNIPSSANIEVRISSATEMFPSTLTYRFNNISISDYGFGIAAEEITDLLRPKVIPVPPFALPNP
ncbi:hypothetical protein GCM10027046_17240 [Uliginosibacterium flavum]|uniref:Lipoprotein n=1 Tax=Uliginosibacterium flavum TaxID=1396831 RepID=A0ABV2TG61_9RHOO